MDLFIIDPLAMSQTGDARIAETTSDDLQPPWPFLHPDPR